MAPQPMSPRRTFELGPGSAAYARLTHAGAKPLNAKGARPPATADLRRNVRRERGFIRVITCFCRSVSSATACLLRAARDNDALASQDRLLAKVAGLGEDFPPPGGGAVQGGFGCGLAADGSKDFGVEVVRKLLRGSNAEADLVPRQPRKQLGVVEDPPFALRVGVSGEARGAFAVFEEQALGIGRADEEADPLARGVGIFAGGIDAQTPGTKLGPRSGEHT